MQIKMSLKPFLPRSLSPTEVLTLDPKDVKPVRIPNKLACLKKIIPFFGTLALITGSIFMGITFITVEDGYVGYSNACTNCSATVYEPGTYLRFAWDKNVIKMLDVKPGVLVVNNECMLNYIVENITCYINNVIKFGSDTILKTYIGNNIVTSNTYGLKYNVSEC